MPPGGCCYEELMGEQGFSSDSSLLYHRHPARRRSPPPGPGTCPTPSTAANQPLLPRHLRLHELFPGEDVEERRCRHRPADGARQRRRAASPTSLPARPRRYYRNAAGDECVFIEAGQRDRRDGLRCARPPARATTCILPRGTTHRWICPREAGRCGRTASRPTAISARRALPVQHGQHLETAPYCERDLRGADRAVAVRRRGRCRGLRQASGHGRHAGHRWPAA